MRAEVQHYYGEVLQSSADLKTSACCTIDAPPPHVRAALAEIHDEVQARYYGCGLVLPEVLDGMRVLDLGCGAGRDCYLLSRLVGPEGRVVGIDMTVAQLEVARRYQAYHADRFKYASSNVEFLTGDLEALQNCGLAENSFDIIVSNCVINLVMDKQAVLDEAFRLLKPGGEVYFADIYSDRRIPEALTADPVLYGECLSGALYWNDFAGLARRAGFVDPRLVTDRPVIVEDPALRQKVGDIRFFSATYRLFKVPELEPDREDYGQSVTYRGTAPHQPDQLSLDKFNVFETGKTASVCGNTYLLLQQSRFAPFFDFHGDTRTHKGIFPGRGVSLPFHESRDATENSCC
jgi:SAM-dependent methyltransferase